MVVGRTETTDKGSVRAWGTNSQTNCRYCGQGLPMSLSLRLRAERKQIAEQMRGLLTSTSPNAAEQWRKLDTVQEELDKQIKSIEQDGIERDLLNTRDIQRPGLGEDDPNRTLTRAEEIRSTREYRKQFASWLGGGEKSQEMRDLESI